MEFPITRTKILVPRPRPDLLSRQRLLDVLYDLLDYKLLLIAAPAGYGKTSLMVDLAQHLKLPVCWYSLDPFDRDPPRFVVHLIASIAQRFPRFGKKAMEAFQGAVADHDLDRLIGTIVNEVDEAVCEHFVLVMDDYHSVDSVPQINRFVNQFTQEVGENCHLIISSRSLLPLPELPLMVARSQVAGLSFKELAFQGSEIQALITQKYHLAISETAAEELAHETEGWITGLLLSTEIMWQGMADRLRVARASGVGLYDYMAQQVLDQQPGEIQDFLLRTAFFEEFDASLCEAVFKPKIYAEDSNLHKLIEKVLRSNLFVMRVGDKGTWLRYHHLFREFLQARMTDERPGERQAILRRMASVYAERGEWEKAHELYRRLDDEESIANLIEQAESSLMATGRLTLLAKWLDELPTVTLDSHPRLLSLRGFVALMLGDVERGAFLLERALNALREAGDIPQLCHALLRRAVSIRNLGKYKASCADADEVIRLTEHDDDLRTLRAEALKVKGVALFRIGRLEEAVSWLEHAKGQYRQLNDPENVESVNMDLGMVYTEVGAYRQAMICLAEALEYWRKVGKLAWQANILNDLGYLHHLLGDYEESAAALEAALARAREGGYAPLQGYILASMGDLYSDLDASEAARWAYGQARAIARRVNNHYLLLHLDLHEAALARSNGELNQARTLLESGRQMAEEGGSELENDLCQIEAGHLAMAEQRWEEAISFLREGARRTGNLGHRLEASRAYLQLATAYEKVGKTQAMKGSLKRAFELASKLDSRQPLVIAGRANKTALAAAAHDAMSGSQASNLLGEIAEFERRLPSLRRHLRRREMAHVLSPARLVVEALGRARVLVGEQVVRSADWQSRAARDLFFLLLAHPDGLTKEEVGSIFWQDYSPGELKLQFKNTVYRLRHALGQQVVLFDQDCYSFNRELDYEYDVENFMGKLAEAESATDQAERESAYTAAIAMYGGQYLPEVDGTWVLPERERLARAFLDANLKLSEFKLGRREFKAALECCERALSEESCSEEAHCMAMQVYAAMGNKSAIVHQFQRCQESLRDEIDATPSQATQVLFERLTR
jgi:LuxR family maltose regulon positive regulatory protein